MKNIRILYINTKNYIYLMLLVFNISSCSILQTEKNISANYIIKIEEVNKKYPEHYSCSYIYMEDLIFDNFKITKNNTNNMTYDLLKYDKSYLITPNINDYLVFCCIYKDIEKGIHNIPSIDTTSTDYKSLLSLEKKLNTEFCNKKSCDFEFIKHNEEVIKVSIWNCKIDYCNCKPYLLNIPENIDFVISIKEIFKISELSDFEKENFKEIFSKYLKKYQLVQK